jgi:hypothetical protein
VCATSGGCFIPSFAVTLYNDIADDQDLSSDVSRCKKQCDELHSGCEGVARASERCSREFVEGLLDAQERGCNDLSKPDSGDCKTDTRHELRDIFDFLSDDYSNALDTCSAEHENCRGTCGGFDD